MRFTINLATRTYLDHRLVNQAFIALIVVMVALLFWNVSRLFSNMGELSRLKKEVAAFEGRLNSRPSNIPEGEYNRQLASLRFHNKIIERKAFNWLGLLGQLENVTPEGVSLASLVPDLGTKDIKLEGRARSFAQVRSYLERLEDSKAFANVLLLSHQELLLGERTRGVQFTITCRAVMQ